MFSFSNGDISSVVDSKCNRNVLQEHKLIRMDRNMSDIYTIYKSYNANGQYRLVYMNNINHMDNNTNWYTFSFMFSLLFFFFFVVAKLSMSFLRSKFQKHRNPNLLDEKKSINQIRFVFLFIERSIHLLCLENVSSKWRNNLMEFPIEISL